MTELMKCREIFAAGVVLGIILSALAYWVIPCIVGTLPDDVLEEAEEEGGAQS